MYFSLLYKKFVITINFQHKEIKYQIISFFMSQLLEGLSVSKNGLLLSVNKKLLTQLISGPITVLHCLRLGVCNFLTDHISGPFTLNTDLRMMNRNDKMKCLRMINRNDNEYLEFMT